MFVLTVRAAGAGAGGPERGPKELSGGRGYFRLLRHVQLSDTAPILPGNMAAAAAASATPPAGGGRGGRSRRLRLLLYGLVALSPHLTLVFVAVGSSVIPATATASAGCARPPATDFTAKSYEILN